MLATPPPAGVQPAPPSQASQEPQETYRVQTSALPGLAHTDAKPLHWLITAAAMAAVVACAGLLQPEAVTATATAAEHRATSQPAPDPAAATYPLDCGDAGRTVAGQASGDLDGDGRPETVAVVRCAAGLGTPPSGVYVLTQRSGAAPRVVATLVDPAQGMSATDVTLRDGVIAAALLGYSSVDIPRCCPDQQENVTWQWNGGSFVRSAHQPARSA